MTAAARLLRPQRTHAVRRERQRAWETSHGRLESVQEQEAPARSPHSRVRTMTQMDMSPVASLTYVRRIMSGRPRIEISWALSHISYGIPKLDQTSLTNIEATLSLVRRECKPALEEGILFEKDVWAITLALTHANLIPPGTPTLVDVTAARLTAAGLLLLTHGPELVRCGLAPSIDLTVDQTLTYTERVFLSWMREATRSTYAMERARPGRDQWLAGAANWAYYHPDRSTVARYWRSDLRRIARLLQARGCLDVDDDGQAIEAPLWEALESGPIEGLVKWPKRGVPGVHTRKIRDLVEASFTKPEGVQVPTHDEPLRDDPNDETVQGKVARRQARARRQVRSLRDSNAATGREPTTEDTRTPAEEGTSAEQPAATYAVAHDPSGALRAVERLRAIRKALADVSRVRRSDDRVTPVARQYFESWMTMGQQPSQLNLATANGVDPGSLSRRIDRMEQDLKAHEALRDWRGWQATG